MSEEYQTRNEEQEKLISETLKNGGDMEVWLIPYMITLSILFVAGVLLIILHLRKRARKSYDMDGEKAKYTGVMDSEEVLAFNIRPSQDNTINNDFSSPITFVDSNIDDMETSVPPAYDPNRLMV